MMKALQEINEVTNSVCILIQLNVMEIQRNFLCMFVCVCDLVKEAGNDITFSEHLWRCLSEIKIVIQ